jgi:hypothetical protein
MLRWTCTLDARPRIARRTEVLDVAVADVLEVRLALGLVFG